MPQPGEGISLAPKIEVDDARVRWSTPALAVDRLVRGCTPAPGAWTTFRGDRVGLEPVTVLGEEEAALVGDPDLAPGALHVTKKAVLVGTATTPVRLGTVRPQGKKAMPAADWARGARIDAGERVGE